MGDFHVLVEATGGHGCERDKKDGETVIGCERSGCPDCITREYIRRLKRSSTHVRAARLLHWPGTSEEVQDDLLTGRRTGSFR